MHKSALERYRTGPNLGYGHCGSKTRADEKSYADLMTAESLNLDDVALFPLPGCVFFPHTLLPLHIFEPRYRAMTEAVLSHPDKLIANGACDENEDVADVVGLGRVVHHEKLPDGRFHILVQGLTRVRIEQEHPMNGGLFRRIRGEAVGDCIDDPARAEDEHLRLKHYLAQLVNACPDAAATLSTLMQNEPTPGMLADMICAATLEESAERQAMLSTCCLHTRLLKAADAVAGMLLKNADDPHDIH